MAGLDRVTDFRALNVPVGGGIIIAGGFAVADAAGGIAVKFLGTTLGNMAAAAGQIAMAYLLRLAAVERLIGPSTSEILSAVQVAAAADALLSIRTTVKGLFTSIGVPALSAGPTRSLGQPAAAPMVAGQPAVYRSTVHLKAAQTRL